MNYIQLLNKIKADSPLSDEELEDLSVWLLTKEGKQAVEEDVRQSWDTFELDAQETYDYKRLLSKINRKIDDTPSKRVVFVRKCMRYALNTAAVAILAVGISFFVTKDTQKPFPQYASTLIPEKIEIYNPRGLRTTVILPDSSKVVLNADSRITYLKDFTPYERAIQLEGEALFEVTNHQSWPFTVEAYNVKMTVLGTSFNVRSYPECQNIRTTLLEGSLCVGTGKHRHILVPGKQSSVNKISLESRIKEVNTANAIGWIEGKLYFQLTPFSEIVATLERMFSVNIQVKNNQLLKKHFTGKFEHGESIEQIMRVLNLSMLSVSVYDKETNTIVIQ
jgi:ferric-dicitrate binding protein FerR (iron transport regulator)